jgi:hypothetical protein
MSIHVMIGTNPDSTTELSRENLTLEVDLTLLVACVYTKPSLSFGAIARRSFPRAPHIHKYSSAVLLPSACSNKKPLSLRHELQDWLNLCGNELWHALVSRAINVLLPVQQRVTRFSTLYRLHLPTNIHQQVHQCLALRKCRTPRSEGYLVKAASLSTKCRSLQINGTGNRNWGYSCAS